MRVLVTALLLLVGCGWITAADDKLSEKFLIGKWTIKDTNATIPDAKVEKSIEFKPRGVYSMNDRGTKTDGTYKLKGTSLDLRDKESGAINTWKDLAIKNGKVTYVFGKRGKAELTRVMEEKKDEKK
jgi:uncharacterized protein (TIGR03066 family)